MLRLTPVCAPATGSAIIKSMRAIVKSLLLLSVVSHFQIANRPIPIMKFTYPEARRDESVFDDYHGTKVADPYRWLEDPDSEETKEFVEAQNAVSGPFIEECEYRQKIKDSLTEKWNFAKYSSPAEHGGHYYYYHNSGLQNQSVMYVQDSLDGEARVFLDPNKLSEDGTLAISGTAFSEDGSYFAYGLSQSGSDWITIKFKECPSGKDLPDTLEHVKFSSMAWTHDNKGMFYNRYPVDSKSKSDGTETTSNYYHRLYYHVLGANQSEDVLAVEFSNEPKWKMETTVANGTSTCTPHFSLPSSNNNANQIYETSYMVSTVAVAAGYSNSNPFYGASAPPAYSNYYSPNFYGLSYSPSKLSMNFMEKTDPLQKQTVIKPNLKEKATKKQKHQSQKNDGSKSVTSQSKLILTDNQNSYENYAHYGYHNNEQYNYSPNPSHDSGSYGYSNYSYWQQYGSYMNGSSSNLYYPSYGTLSNNYYNVGTYPYGSESSYTSSTLTNLSQTATTPIQKDGQNDLCSPTMTVWPSVYQSKPVFPSAESDKYSTCSVLPQTEPVSGESQTKSHSTLPFDTSLTYTSHLTCPTAESSVYSSCSTSPASYSYHSTKHAAEPASYASHQSCPVAKSVSYSSYPVGVPSSYLPRQPCPTTEQMSYPPRQPCPTAEQVSYPPRQPCPTAEQVSYPPRQPCPTAEQVSYPPRQPCPVAEQVSYPPRQPCPVAEQVSYPPRQPCPVVEQVSYPPRQPCPVAEQVSYPPRQPCPVAEQVSYPPRQPCPVAEQVSYPPRPPCPVAKQVSYPPRQPCPVAEPASYAPRQPYYAAEPASYPPCPVAGPASYPPRQPCPTTEPATYLSYPVGEPSPYSSPASCPVTESAACAFYPPNYSTSYPFYPYWYQQNGFSSYSHYSNSQQPQPACNQNWSSVWPQKTLCDGQKETTDKGMSKIGSHSKTGKVASTPDTMFIPNYRGAAVSDCGKYLLLSLNEGCDPVNRLFYVELDKLSDGITGILPYTVLVDNFDAQYEYITNEGTVFTFLTNLNSPKYKVINIDFSKPEQANWQTLIEEDENAVLEWVSCVDKNKLILCYLKDVKNKMYIHSLETGKLLKEIPLDIGTVIGCSGKKKNKEIFIHFMSFLTAGIIYRVDVSVDDPKPEVYRVIKVNNFDFSQFEIKQIFYPSKDGTKIPMFLVHKQGLVLDGKNPTYLYGYGGFEISIKPTFSVSRLVFLKDLGGLFAIANIRGGGEYGETWHKSGTHSKKQNVFDDFQAAAEYLIDQKYTTPKKLVIHGHSNGGLLIAACINQRPELYGSAVAQVGVLDMLRFHKFTIGHAWTTDFGCSDVPEHFKFLKDYSPLHNIRVPKDDIQYPFTLLVTADHDDRVVPLHSLKYIAELQHTMKGEEKQTNPLMIKVDTKAGHGRGKPTTKMIQEFTDLYCFIMRSLELNWHES